MATNAISSILSLSNVRLKSHNLSTHFSPNNSNSHLAIIPNSTTTTTKRCVLRRRRYAVATVSLSLPTTKTERAPTEKPIQWSGRAIRAFAMAELEARKLKYPNTGTESLLMGILVEGTSLAAKVLRDSGITVLKVREETVNLLGKSDMYYHSPERPPLTKLAQKVLDWAVDEKLKSGEDGEITPGYLLLGIWSMKESAGHKILETLGFNDEKAEELAMSIDKDVAFGFR